MSVFLFIKFSLVSRKFWKNLVSRSFKIVQKVEKILSNISLSTASVLQCEGVIDNSVRHFLHTTGQITAYSTRCFGLALLHQ